MKGNQRQYDAALKDDLLALLRHDYEYLRYTNPPGLKDAFIAGDVREPDLVYTDVESEYVGDRVEALQAMETVVAAYDDNIVRRAYTAKFEELRAKYDLLLAASRGDDQKAFDASVAAYGMPRDDIFRFTLREVRDNMARVEERYGEVPLVREAVAILSPIVSLVDDTVYPFEPLPLPGTKEYEDRTALNAADIQAAYTTAFARLGIEGWQAVVDAPGERTTFSVSHSLKTVFIPSDEDLQLRKHPLTREHVEASIAHEVGTHIVRAERGAQSPLFLLSIGLAGYLRGEEGVATYAEQQWAGARHFAGELGYFCVGLAVGLDGHPRTFRELYKVLIQHALVIGLEHALEYNLEVDIEKLTARAKRQAWARSLRTYRGTTGNTPGTCFTKDIVYREGNIAIWKLVTEDPAWVEKFQLGKYDPANADHVALLRDMGML